MHPDFKELLCEFNAKRVEYLVVGPSACYRGRICEMNAHDLGRLVIVSGCPGTGKTTLARALAANRFALGDRT